MTYFLFSVSFIKPVYSETTKRSHMAHGDDNTVLSVTAFLFSPFWPTITSPSHLLLMKVITNVCVSRMARQLGEMWRGSTDETPFYGPIHMKHVSLPRTQIEYNNFKIMTTVVVVVLSE
jgi:hypothetical protein